MDAAARREEIIKKLNQAESPVSAASLAALFSVSRQIIVGDIALLRASGEEIEATPRGYVIAHPKSGQIIRRIAVQHTSEQTKEELYTIVDQGCTVLDVIVSHPIYGELTGQLQLSSRYDVDSFIQRISSSDAHPLSFLTEGIHLHTLACPDEAALQRVTDALKKLGFLL